MENSKDILVKASIEGVRIYVLTSRNLVQKAKDLHNTSHLATAALGRAMSGALLLAATMKEKERISITIDGDGPLGKIIVNAEDNHVRGYVENPNIYLPLKNGKLDVGAGVGAGNIIVSRFRKDAEPFVGYSELVNGEIASDITNYLYTSEQIPSSVALGVLVNKEGDVLDAGGIFIQAMPGVADDVLKNIENKVLSMPYVTELLQSGFGPKDIIEKYGEGLEVNILDTIDICFECTCSDEKVKNTLRALSIDDLIEMSKEGKTEIRCDYCNKTYTYSKEDLLELVNEKKSNKSQKKVD
jgi:molecular chaperone Hsp33